MFGHASWSDWIWRAFLSPDEDTGAEETVWWQQIRTISRPPTNSLEGSPTTQVYPDNTRILSAPVTGETPLRRVDGGEDELYITGWPVRFYGIPSEGGNYIICVWTKFWVVNQFTIWSGAFDTILQAVAVDVLILKLGDFLILVRLIFCRFSCSLKMWKVTSSQQPLLVRLPAQDLNWNRQLLVPPQAEIGS